MIGGDWARLQTAVLAAGLIFAVSSGRSSKAQSPRGRTTDVEAQSLVARFLPEGFRERDCFAVYKQAAPGDPVTIFAVYRTGNLMRGELWVIERDVDGRYVARNVGPPGFDFGQVTCSAEALTIDRWGTRVLTISLGGTNPVQSAYVFRWKSGHLTSVGPTNNINNVVSSDLTNPFFANLYGDGTLAVWGIDDFSREDSAPIPVSIYRLRNGRFEFAQHAVDAMYFMCAKRCQQEAHEFTVGQDARGPFVLQLGNGDLNGGSRVQHAQIRINGNEIAEAAKLNQRTGALTIPIPDLQPGRNTISATLTRAPGVEIGKLYYAIEDQPLPK